MAKLPDIDYAAEADRICERLREITFDTLRRRGLVVAMSGGIDSSCSAALAVRALGKDRVFGLLLPERDSSSNSSRLGRMLAEHLGVPYTLHDISSTLASIGCYSAQDEVLKRVLPGFDDGWKFKLAITNAMGGKVSITHIIAQDPAGNSHDKRLSAPDYLQIVAATNFKQRVRKTLEYYHGDRLNYAVVGTPNRLEYDQGFFVKQGDGAADFKPIAHLYKSQVYDLARHLGVPAEICGRTPTTDTFSLAQTQEEFYFALPYQQMDLCLYAHNHAVPADDVAPVVGLTAEQVRRVYDDIEAKRRATHPLHVQGVLLGEVPEIG